LADHFLNILAGEENARPLMTEDALRTLQAYAWPGNIRQLRNVIEKAVAMCRGGAITAEYLRKELNFAGFPSQQPRTESVALPAEPQQTLGLSANGRLVTVGTEIEDSEGEPIAFRDAKDTLVDKFERIYLENLLERNKQNVSATARDAQIDRRHLYRLLKKHGLMADD
jgi:DNA-binding NtrC family response regulator